MHIQTSTRYFQDDIDIKNKFTCLASRLLFNLCFSVSINSLNRIHFFIFQHFRIQISLSVVNSSGSPYPSYLKSFYASTMYFFYIFQSVPHHYFSFNHHVYNYLGLALITDQRINLMNRYLITSLYIETPQCLNNEAICSTDEYARVIFPHKIRILQ